MPNRVGRRRTAAAQLRARLREAEEALDAIRRGAVDAVVVDGPRGVQLFTLRGAQEPYRVLVEAMSDGAVTVDGSGLVLYANRRAGTLLGCPADQLVGRPLTQSLPEELRTLLSSLLSRCLRTGIGGEVCSGSEPGEAALRLAVTALPGDVDALACVIVTDVREASARERSLREIAEALRRSERALDAANRALLVEVEERRRASRAKDEFLATMSHELRTPLNGVLGFTELLLEEVPGPLTPRQAECLADVRRCGKHLLHLVNDLLDLSKIDAGREEPTCAAFDAVGAVRDVCGTMREIAAQARLTLSVRAQGPILVRSDERRFRQILYNLLSNALKFTPAGGAVEVALAAPDATRVQLSVRDTGIGIRAEDISRLFRDFEQLESGLTRRYGGTGLGLALTRRVVQLLGGSIDVQSAIGEGSVFRVVLPRELDAVRPCHPCSPSVAACT